MSPRSDSGPAWLFSFVDLAFLLLIAMTQLGGDGGARPPDLGEIAVPRIRAGSTADLPSDARARWQLRVHPPGGPDAGPFELARPGPADPDPRVGSEELARRLARLHAAGGEKPLLAPHEDSRSRDLLDAVALLEEYWPSHRRATVAPALGLP